MVNIAIEEKTIYKVNRVETHQSIGNALIVYPTDKSPKPPKSILRIIDQSQAHSSKETKFFLLNPLYLKQLVPQCAASGFPDAESVIRVAEQSAAQNIKTFTLDAFRILWRQTESELRFSVIQTVNFPGLDWMIAELKDEFNLDSLDFPPIFRTLATKRIAITAEPLMPLIAGLSTQIHVRSTHDFLQHSIEINPKTGEYLSFENASKQEEVLPYFFN